VNSNLAPMSPTARLPKHYRMPLRDSVNHLCAVSRLCDGILPLAGTLLAFLVLVGLALT
jgi:hypothetical protein